jgi:hypothetical protein
LQPGSYPSLRYSFTLADVLFEQFLGFLTVKESNPLAVALWLPRALKTIMEGNLHVSFHSYAIAWPGFSLEARDSERSDLELALKIENFIKEHVPSH